MEKFKKGGMFAGINSYSSYKPLLDEILKNTGFRYILKGTPGSGKSTLIKRIAGEACERGIKVRYIYCSSDTSSLDGVIIGTNEIAMCDGTSPHPIEMKLPLIKDKIIDLLPEYNENFKKEYGKRLSELYSEKAKAYKRIYTLLEDYRRIDDSKIKIVCNDNSKSLIEKDAECFAENISCEKGNSYIYPLMCISSNGFNLILPQKSNKTICVTGNCAKFYIEKISSLFLQKGIAFGIIPSPINHTEIYGIYIDSAGLLILNDKYKKFKYDEKYETDIKENNTEYLNLLDGMTDKIINNVKSKFAEAKSLHGEIEKIYSLTADFERNNKIAESLIKNIF